MSEDAETVLRTRVMSDKSIVTYRTLSRILSCHVNEAKKHLYAFHAENPEGTHATYLIVGILPTVSATNGHAKEENGMEVDEEAPSSQPQTAVEATQNITMQLVQQEEFEDAKKRFESISSIAVYSLQPGRLTDPAILAATNAEVQTSAEMIKSWKQSSNGEAFGLVQCKDRKVFDKVSPVKKEKTGSTSKLSASTSDTKSLKRKQSDTPAEPEAAVTIKKAVEKKDVKGKGKAKATTSKNKQRIADSDEEEDEDEAAKVKAEQEQAELEAAAAMDWDEDDMAGEEEEKKPAAKSKEKAKPKAKASKEPKSDTPAEKVRKTRTVKRTYVDEKGYKRTRDEEESYSESEAESKTKAKPKKSSTSGSKDKEPSTSKPVKKEKKEDQPKKGGSTKSKGKPGEQQSMMNFFGKK